MENPSTDGRHSAYYSVVGKADADLDEALSHVRAEEDAGRINPVEAAAERCELLERHLELCQQARLDHLGRHAVSEPIDLAYLCHHYGEAYEINMRRGRYEARRRDDGTVLTADSADALLDLIRADYAARPVSRRAHGPGRPETPGCRFLPEG